MRGDKTINQKDLTNSMFESENLLECISEKDLAAYTLNVIEKLIRMGIDKSVLRGLSIHLKKINNPNERKKVLDAISKLLKEYEDMPKALDIIIDELTMSKDPEKYVKILSRKDVIDIIRNSYEFAEKNYQETPRIRDAIESTISFILSHPEDIERIKKYRGLEKIITSYKGVEAVTKLIEAEKEGLLRKDEVEDYLSRIAELAEEIYKRFYNSPLTLIGRVFMGILQTHLSKIADAIERPEYFGSKDPREPINRILRNFESIYSDKNIRNNLIKLNDRLGLSPGIIEGLSNIRGYTVSSIIDPTVFKVLTTLLSKEEFIMLIESLKLYGESAVIDAIKKLADAIDREIRSRRYSKRYFKYCLESRHSDKCEVPKKSKKLIIEEAVKRLIGAFRNSPYFSDLSYMLIDYLGELEPNETKLYIEVVTSPSSVKLFDLLYKEDWEWNRRKIEKYILPSVKLLIKKFEEDGTKLANRLIKIMKSYAGLNPRRKDGYFGDIAFYTYQILYEIAVRRDKENVEKFLDLLETLLKKYIIGNKVKRGVALEVLKDINAFIRDYESLEKEDPDRYYESIRSGEFKIKLSETLEYYSKPEVIESIAKKYSGFYS